MQRSSESEQVLSTRVLSRVVRANGVRMGNCQISIRNSIYRVHHCSSAGVFKVGYNVYNVSYHHGCWNGVLNNSDPNQLLEQATL